MSDNPSPMRHPDPDDLPRAPESAAVAMLLDEQRAIRTSLLVLRTVSRVVSVILAVSISVLSPLETTEFVVLALVAITLLATWFTEDRHLTWVSRGLGETLSHHIGGRGEDLYIRSTFYYRPSPMLVRQFEPLMWLSAIVAALVVGWLS